MSTEERLQEIMQNSDLESSANFEQKIPTMQTEEAGKVIFDIGEKGDLDFLDFSPEKKILSVKKFSKKVRAQVNKILEESGTNYENALSAAGSGAEKIEKELWGNRAIKNLNDIKKIDTSTNESLSVISGYEKFLNSAKTEILEKKFKESAENEQNKQFVNEWKDYKKSGNFLMTTGILLAGAGAAAVTFGAAVPFLGGAIGAKLVGGTVATGGLILSGDGIKRKFSKKYRDSKKARKYENLTENAGAELGELFANLQGKLEIAKKSATKKIENMDKKISGKFSAATPAEKKNLWDAIESAKNNPHGFSFSAANFNFPAAEKNIFLEAILKNEKIKNGFAAIDGIENKNKKIKKNLDSAKKQKNFLETTPPVDVDNLLTAHFSDVLPAENCPEISELIADIKNDIPIEYEIILPDEVKNGDAEVATEIFLLMRLLNAIQLNAAIRGKISADTRSKIKKWIYEKSAESLGLSAMTDENSRVEFQRLKNPGQIFDKAKDAILFAQSINAENLVTQFVNFENYLDDFLELSAEKKANFEKMKKNLPKKAAEKLQKMWDEMAAVETELTKISENWQKEKRERDDWDTRNGAMLTNLQNKKNTLSAGITGATGPTLTNLLAEIGSVQTAIDAVPAKPTFTPAPNLTKFLTNISVFSAETFFDPAPLDNLNVRMQKLAKKNFEKKIKENLTKKLADDSQFSTLKNLPIGKEIKIRFRPQPLDLSDPEILLTTDPNCTEEDFVLTEKKENGEIILKKSTGEEITIIDNAVQNSELKLNAVFYDGTNRETVSAFKIEI